MTEANVPRASMTDFNEWFSVTDKDHLKAYKHLIEHGEWPSHFIPADVERKPDWNETLLNRIALHYIRMVTEKTVRGHDPNPNLACPRD